MASNSRREQILVRMEAKLNELSSLKAVDRKPLTGMKELSSIPVTKIPLAIVLGKLPVPAPKESGRGPGSNSDINKSVLGIDILVYIQDAKTPDTTISNIADDVWAKLFEDVQQGFKWVIATKVLPDANIAVWNPYAAFKMGAEITYLHGKEGI